MAYADDIIVMSRNAGDTKKVIESFQKLESEYNLIINKKKCEILEIAESSKTVDEINGIEVKRKVRYLGVNVVYGRENMRKEAE